MSRPPRPRRAIILLSVLILMGAGITAYLVNVPILWIAAFEVVALAGIAVRLSQPRQAHPAASGRDDSPAKPDQGPA